MTTVHTTMTAEQLLSHPGRCELVRGELIEMPFASMEHGIITARIGAKVFEHVLSNRLGDALGAGIGFHIAHDPDTVRAPDAAFVRRERIPAGIGDGYYPGPPDLAVEVVEPEDRASEVMGKVLDWLAAGCESVWVVDPGTRTVTVYRGQGHATVLGINDRLADASLLPGFELPVADIFGE